MPQRHVITGHGSAAHPLALEAQAGGLLTDGMGADGHNASIVGQDYAVIQAGAGQMAQLDLRALWLEVASSVRVTVDGKETLLQGTVLPPGGGGRRFRSTVGGKIEVLLVTSELESLVFFSFAVHTACIDASGCGGHGSCDVIAGTCQCDSVYAGPMCHLNLTRSCRTVQVWNETASIASFEKLCKAPSPTDFAYPSHQTMQPMSRSVGFRPAADSWRQGKDDLRGASGAKYSGGVLVPDGRVLLVPHWADHVGLYDPDTDMWREGKDNLSSVGPKKYNGGVLLPDGRVLLVPAYANHVGLYDPNTDTWRQGKDDLSSLGVVAGRLKYSNGVLLPDGRVLLVPNSANYVGLYKPSTDVWTQGKDYLPTYEPSLECKWYSAGVLLPNGRVLLVPCSRYSARRVGLYDPRTDTLTQGKDTIQTYTTYNGGVLMPDGRVLLVPASGAEHVGLYDTTTDTWTQGKDTLHLCGLQERCDGAYSGGVLLPDGRVLLVPRYSIGIDGHGNRAARASHVGLYDPSMDTWTRGTDDLGPPSGRDEYHGGVRLPDGRALLVPANANRVGLYDAGGTSNGAAYTVASLAPANDALLLPYYNK